MTTDMLAGQMMPYCGGQLQPYQQAQSAFSAYKRKEQVYGQGYAHQFWPPNCSAYTYSGSADKTGWVQSAELSFLQQQERLAGDCLMGQVPKLVGHQLTECNPLYGQFHGQGRQVNSSLVSTRQGFTAGSTWLPDVSRRGSTRQEQYYENVGNSSSRRLLLRQDNSSYLTEKKTERTATAAPAVRCATSSLAELTKPLTIDCSIEYEMPAILPIPKDSTPILQILKRKTNDTSKSPPPASSKCTRSSKTAAISSRPTLQSTKESLPTAPARQQRETDSKRVVGVQPTSECVEVLYYNKPDCRYVQATGTKRKLSSSARPTVKRTATEATTGQPRAAVKRQRLSYPGHDVFYRQPAQLMLPNWASNPLQLTAPFDKPSCRDSNNNSDGHGYPLDYGLWHHKSEQLVPTAGCTKNSQQFCPGQTYSGFMNLPSQLECSIARDFRSGFHSF